MVLHKKHVLIILALLNINYVATFIHSMLSVMFW